jgi:hypothetical protein
MSKMIYVVTQCDRLPAFKRRFEDDSLTTALVSILGLPSTYLDSKHIYGVINSESVEGTRAEPAIGGLAHGATGTGAADVRHGVDVR